MEDVIGTEWQLLYANNPKVQAFGVCKGDKVLWQTSNWNLVDAIDEIAGAPKNASSKVKIGRVEYQRVTSNKDSFLGAAKKNKGYLVIVRIEDNAWVVAEVGADAVPELAKIDVARTAVNLIGLI